MTHKEKIKAEIGQHITAANPYQRKQILESFEYKDAMGSGDVEGALQFVLGVLHGAGKTKADAKLKAKKIETEKIFHEFM